MQDRYLDVEIAKLKGYKVTNVEIIECYSLEEEKPLTRVVPVIEEYGCLAYDDIYNIKLDIVPFYTSGIEEMQELIEDLREDNVGIKIFMDKNKIKVKVKKDLNGYIKNVGNFTDVPGCIARGWYKFKTGEEWEEREWDAEDIYKKNLHYPRSS